MSGILVRIVLATAGAVSLVATASAAQQSAARGPLQVAVLAPPSGLRDAGDVSEPHLALDPENPSVLVAVAQTRDIVAWRSDDGGITWTGSRPLAGKSGKGGYAGGDPVVGLGPDGSALLAAVAIDRGGRCTLLNRVGAYRSADGARSFGPLAVVSQTLPLPRHFFGLPPLPTCPLPKGLAHVSNSDKPWVAIDTTNGPHRGSAYLAWTLNEEYGSRTFQTLLVAASHDGGKTYGRAVVVAPKTRTPEALEQYSQIAVRPDGTLDVVWNDVRSDRTVILHASSTDGGASFGPPDRVYTLPPKTTPLGLVTSLAVSPAGRLAVCWSASTRPKVYLPRIGCALSSDGGSWSSAVTPFAHGGSQYLPAVAFEGERLWVAAYRSTAGTTRVLLTSSDDGRTFADPVVLAQRAYGRSRLCAPHPPDCAPRQRFVGDYIGAIAAPGKVWVDFVLPVAGPTTPKRVFVATLPTA
jgi:hypothetical protein